MSPNTNQNALADIASQNAAMMHAFEQLIRMAETLPRVPALDEVPPERDAAIRQDTNEGMVAQIDLQAMGLPQGIALAGDVDMTKFGTNTMSERTDFAENETKRSDTKRNNPTHTLG